MTTSNRTASTCVLYDGSCPICSREIDIYRALPAQEPIQWLDISCLSEQSLHGRDKSVLMQRFHVLSADGELLSGAQAFVYLWRLLPGWRYVAYFSKLPGILVMMELTYRLFLILRPRLQKIVSLAKIRA